MRQIDFIESRSEPLRVSKTSIYALTLTPVVFCLSLLLLDAYTGGDQVHYRNLYEALAKAPLSEMPMLLREIASSSEPLTGLILWAGARSGIDKDIFIASLNVLLVSGVFVLARRHKAPGSAILLLLTNFYLLVLITAAERQKIAFIFIVLAMLLDGNARRVVLLVSPFAHLTSFLFLASALSFSIENSVRALLLRGSVFKRNLLLLSVAIVVILFLGVVLLDGLLVKASHYLKSDISFVEFSNISLLLFVCLFITRHRLRIVLALCPLFVAVYFFGGSHVNIIAVVVALYLLLTERRINHPLAYVLMGYFSVKSIPFLYNIFAFGDGFLKPPELIRWALIFE